MEEGRCVFEDKTRENLKADMMAELNKTSGLSTLEGGYSDQVFGPMAVELEKVYGAMDAVFMLMAVDETCGGLIDIAAGNYSMERKPGVTSKATATFTGTPGTMIPAETFFSTADGRFYSLPTSVTLDAEGHGNGTLVAEEPGVRYDAPAGAIDRMLTNLAELESFEVGAATGGVDEEGDAALVGRYYDKLQRPVTSGNPNHYRQWAMEVPGVGEAKVISLANGPGTVGVTLVSAAFGPVENEVVAAVVAHIEAERPAGISAAPNIKSAVALPINVVAVLKLDTSVTAASASAAFKARLGAYLQSVVAAKYAETYDNAKNDHDYALSYNRVATILMTTPGVMDYTSLTINGGKVDVAIGKDYVPTVGEVTVT